jgi:hypothetical protein
LNVISIRFAMRRKLAAEEAAFAFMAAKNRALRSSRPRVERFSAIATRCPLTVAYATTGP